MGRLLRTLPCCRIHPRTHPRQHLLRSFQTTPFCCSPEEKHSVSNASDISHSYFISSASPSSDFNPAQKPTAGLDTSSPWQGKLSPTTSHLFKLVLPLPTRSWDISTPPQPTAFLLHPSQPLSHLSRLIAGSLPPHHRDAEISYLALTGQESDLDTHLRKAEEDSSNQQEGGPHLGERRKSEGRWQEVSWSQSTDLSDFIKQSCLNERFKIVIAPSSADNPEVTLEVVIPSFASRTTHLRGRLVKLTKELDGLTKKKKQIDYMAHKGAQRLAVLAISGGVVYWGAVIRYTFFTDAGWDVMEPVTWATGFAALLGSAAFLVYHNREVSYSSLLDLSITARRRRLYDLQGLDLEKWTEMVAEAKTLRREIARIAAEYDIEWKGELENLAQTDEPLPDGKTVTTGETSDKASDEKLDIDRTIDEASDLASETEEKQAKEKASQRKGEVVDEPDEAGRRRREEDKGRKASEQRGREKGRELTVGND